MTDTPRTDPDRDYVTVKRGTREERVRKAYNMNLGGSQDSTASSNKTTATTLVEYTGTAPPSPAELYRGQGAVTKQTVADASIYYYKIRYTKDLRTNKTLDQPVRKDFQILYGKLKGADPDLLLVPVRSEEIENQTPEEQEATENKKCNYIDAPVHIPTTDPILLSKYFSFTIER